MIKKYALFKIISTLIKKPKEYSVRELAKVASVSTSTSKHCLDYLFSKNIVKRRIIGKTYQYSLNLDNIITRHIKILASLNTLSESGLVNELIKKYPGIISIILYGSVATGNDTPASDIDLLIITRKKIKITPLKPETKLKREVTYIAYTIAEWREKSIKNKVFYDRIILDGIALYGEIPMVR